MKYSIKFYNRLTVEKSEARIAEPRYVLILYAIIDRSCFTIEDLKTTFSFIPTTFITTAGGH